MKIHFIAIGGSVMHQLAIILKKQNNIISGSDDDIFEPAYSRLKQHDLLPSKFGWQIDNISEDLDAIILGMHAKTDNVELLKAQKLNIPIYSYPEYIYKQNINKQRIVVTGSCGKTTITSMIIHLLEHTGKSCNYLLGGQIIDKSDNVKIVDKSIFFIAEGDEYPTSPLDSKPKFLNYNPHIAIITGIDWDHVNIYPTLEAYQKTFESLVFNMPKMGEIIYNQYDKTLKNLTKKYQQPDTTLKPFINIKHKVSDGITWVYGPKTKEYYPLPIFGTHNIQNLGFVLALCDLLAIDEEDFFVAMQSFKGVKKRMQRIYNRGNTNIFLDFAHTPTKLKTAIKGLKSQFSGNKNIICYELHSYSNLNSDFLQGYQKTLDKVEILIIYYNPENVKRKNLDNLSESRIRQVFDNRILEVFTNIENLKRYCLNLDLRNTNLAFISSGNFDNLDFSIFELKE